MTFLPRQEIKVFFFKESSKQVIGKGRVEKKRIGVRGNHGNMGEIEKKKMEEEKRRKEKKGDKRQGKRKKM